MKDPSPLETPKHLDGSRDSLLVEAASRARRHLEGIADRPVAPSPDAVLALGQLAFPSGLDDSPVLGLLDAVGSPANLGSNRSHSVVQPGDQALRRCGTTQYAPSENPADRAPRARLSRAR